MDCIEDFARRFDPRQMRSIFDSDQSGIRQQEGPFHATAIWGMAVSGSMHDQHWRLHLRTPADRFEILDIGLDGSIQL